MDKNFEPLIASGLIWVIEKETYLEVESVAILPAYQKRGFGRKLMSYAEELALQKGCPSIRLYTNAALLELVTFYESLGYIEEKRETDQGFNRVFLIKELV